MSQDFEAARTQFIAGVQHAEAGRLDEAEAAFRASLAQMPGRPSTLLNLAAVCIRLGRPADALSALDEALARTPDDADAWFSRGQTLQALGRPAEALQSYGRVLALDPKAAPAWTQQGSILKDMGRLPEAAESFRQALAHGGDAELNRYFLASVEGGAAPTAAPRAYVETLFDSYAEEFDEHLVAKLGYRTPQLLAELLPAEARFDGVLDLGCGTGLMAPLLAARATHIDGVDLSSQMLAKAAALKLYRELRHGDVAEDLRQAAARGRSYGLVVAADVFVYVGALDDVFSAARQVLPAGGHFLFSVEESDAGHALQLRSSSRYAHSEAEVRRLSAATGMQVLRLERATLRHDQRRPITGLLVLLELPGAG
jgi:predicted TPR repeat methyltransferase